MASEAPKTQDLTFARAIVGWRIWWREAVLGTVDQAAVIEKRRAECTLSARYLFMTAMSAGIAVLGLLQGSAAVVIGAMLLSPLMDPIMGLGFALATGDYKWLRQSAVSLAWGSLLAVILCALIVFMSPLQELTPEIASRTRPTLFDLLVALFSALAGAYAMIRGRDGTIVGVAIATALMPPLAVVGYGMATANWTVFSGALLLYVTNLMAIALTAALMARLYGFRTALSDRQTQFQTVVIVVAFVALAVPLGLTLVKIAQETNATRQIRGEILDSFGPNSRLSAIEVDWSAEPVSVDATVFTPKLQPDAEAQASRAMARDLGRPVNLVLTQYQVGTNASAAEEAQLNNARAEEEAAAAERAADLTARLALVSGVDEAEIMVDRQRRRAMVKAQELDGATLKAYADLEARISATEPEWDVRLIPPAKALPAVEFADGKPTESGTSAIKLLSWAAARVDAPVILSGNAEATAVVEAALKDAGIRLVSREVSASDTVTASWGSIAR